MLRSVLSRALIWNAVLYALSVPLALAQTAQLPPALPQTKIQVNILNTCRPAKADLEEMSQALLQVKGRPVFSSDFEISRGVSTPNESATLATGAPAVAGAPPAIWVRIREEFPEKAVLTNAQYSLSVEGHSISEVLALHLRESREEESRAGEIRNVLQVVISDSVTGSPAQIIKADTPPDRIRIERFGTTSIVLARCGGIDQRAYQPLFLAAGKILQQYRVAMAVKRVVPVELARLPGRKESKAAPANH